MFAIGMAGAGGFVVLKRRKTTCSARPGRMPLLRPRKGLCPVQPARWEGGRVNRRYPSLVQRHRLAPGVRKPDLRNCDVIHRFTMPASVPRM